MIGFVKGIAKEVAPHGIVINSLAPAVISTPMNSNTSEFIVMNSYMLIQL